MDRNIDHFIRYENLAHYRRLLAEPGVADDQVRHNQLIRLLAEEEAKETVLNGQR
jgi:hypothetical protein